LADVEIRPFHPSQTDELLKFLVKWTPNHPELGDRAVFDWQKANGYVAMSDGRIVGHLAQIPHEFRYGKRSGQEGTELMGPGISFILDMSNDEIRKKSGRGLLKHFENNQPPYFAAIGIVPEIEEPYKRRGYSVRRDFTNLYGRFMNPSRALKYWSRSQLYAPAMSAANIFYRARRSKGDLPVEKITKFEPEWDELWEKLKCEQYELYGIRTADFLNYKLSQPGKEYHVYKHKNDGYIIFRLATHPLKDLRLVKICDMAGTSETKPDLISLAMSYAYEVKADGIVAMAADVDKPIYKKAGMFISEPKPLVISPHLKKQLHITFFDSDLDHLW